MRRSIPLLAVAVVYALLAHLGCAPAQSANSGGTPGPAAPKMIQVLNANIERALESPPAPINAARNETASTVLQLAHLPKPSDKSVLTLRILPLELEAEKGKGKEQEKDKDKDKARIDVAQIRAYQVLAMPVDANRAGYVRHTGQQAASRTLPRALLPVPLDNDKINVTALRDPSEPLKPASRIGLSDEPALLWLDVQIPPTAKPGRYNSSIELQKDGQVIETVPLSVNVYDFVLPDERHLHMVGRIEWESLEALYPDLFETTTPAYMSRNAPKYAAAVKLLDQLVALAHEHRTTVVVPRLQPIVKWPANQPPQVDWTEFDTIVEPWLGGGGFADKIPVGYWPLPRIDYLDRYPVALQNQYWSAAAEHFVQQGWMERAWVEVEKETKGRANVQESIKLSEQVAGILDAHPKLRVSLPLEDQQLQFRDKNNPKLIDRAKLDRLMTAAAGLVFAAPQQPPSAEMLRLRHWLRTDLPGLVPYIGAGGDERDVRLWAWLAFLRKTEVIGWDGALPHTRSPQEAADPNDLTWFYPGRWFGVDQPVPTIQLKWLRRAQQDFEYLYLAKQRGESLYAWVMARLMTKQVQTPPNEEPDPTHGLLSGTTDQTLWTQALELMAKKILAREPGKERDEDLERNLNRDTFVWMQPQERPLLIPRTATWGRAVAPGNWVDLRLGVDAYNASDMGLEGQFQWANAPRGWEFNPQPVAVTQLNAIQMYKVRRFDMEARVNLDRLTPETRQPIALNFVEGRYNKAINLKVAVPVAVSDKREGPLNIDGALGDWDDAADSIQQGPMVVMLDRPALQKQTMRLASTNSSIYSNWAAKSFYVAFKLDGIGGGGDVVNGRRVEKNTVDYQLRRAWGEDLCEILIQPIYDKPGDVGQVVHLVCKPRGQLVTVSMKHSPRNQRLLGDAFSPVLGSNVEVANSVEGSVWRGEVKIPWEVINDKDHQGQRPTLMRFNFAQHKHATGESSSWAGPIDYGRDDSFMGLLYLRDTRAPGMGSASADGQ
jgi:hypothetical protein